MSRDLIQVWSAPQCQSGAVALGPLTTWTSARVTASAASPPVLAIGGILSSELVTSDVREGAALKVISATRGVSWWVVTQINDAIEADTASLRAAPLRALLALRGLVRDGESLIVTPPERSLPATLLADVVLSNAAEDALDWLEVGTVESEQLLTLGALRAQTRAQVLARIEAETGCTAVLRPLVPDGSTGFALDLLRDPASTAPTRVLSPHVALDTLARTRDVQRAPSRIRPVDSAGRGLGVTVWEVTAVSGVRITLRDPRTDETRWPIRADGQCVGCFVVQTDGTTAEITSSRASDSTVEVDDATGLTVGDRVRLVSAADGTPVGVIEWPALAARRGIAEGVQTATTEPLTANLAENPYFADWSGVSAPVGWAEAGGTYRVGEYPRASNQTFTGIVCDGGALAGASGINFRNAPANARFFFNEYLVVGGTPFRVGNSVAVASPTGTGSIVFASGTLPAPVADGASILFLGQPPNRPLTIPEDATSNDLLRLLTSGGSATPPSPTAVRFQSPPIRALYRAAAPTLRFAAGITVHNGKGSTVTAANGPRVMLRNNASNALLAWGQLGADVASGATVHETITGSATLSADTTVDLAFATYGDSDLFVGVRWVALWLHPSDTPPIVDGSTANAAWHAANDAIEATAVGSTIRLTGVDVAALLNDGAPLQLGQVVRLRVPAWSADASLRIVSLDYSLADADRVSLELGAVRPRLSAITVSL